MTEPPRLSVLIYRAHAPASPESRPRAAQSAQALNRAALEVRSEFLALVPAGSRLPDGLLPRCHRALGDSPSTQAVYPAHSAGDAAARPSAARGPFRPALLLRRNPVGPVAVIRRSAWEELAGLRTGQSLHMALWDFWLRLVLAHPEPDSIRPLPALLAHCPPHGGTPARDEGRAKALLVVHTPGAFEGDVCRWAMALLRGEAWARPHAPGLIPTAQEVRRMWESGRKAGTRQLLQSA